MDGKETARIVIQAVGDRVVVASASVARPSYRLRYPRGVFRDRVAVAFEVGHCSNIELVEVVDGDPEHLVRVRTIGRRGADRDVATGAVRFTIDGSRHRDTPVLASMANRPPSLSCRL